MVLVAFMLFFLLVAAWLKAPSKTPPPASDPQTTAIIPGTATA